MKRIKYAHVENIVRAGHAPLGNKVVTADLHVDYDDGTRITFNVIAIRQGLIGIWGFEQRPALPPDLAKAFDEAADRAWEAA